MHLQARCTPTGLRPRQVRLLGDDERGYLLTGLADVTDGGDFWFATIGEAFARARELNVADDDWTEITEVGQAEML